MKLQDFLTTLTINGNIIIKLVDLEETPIIIFFLDDEEINYENGDFNLSSEHRFCDIKEISISNEDDEDNIYINIKLHLIKEEE